MVRPRHVWTAFALCLAVLLGALAWASALALRAERAETMARRQALLEEDVRLALSRMDLALAPLISRLAALPYFAYVPFSSVQRAYSNMYAEIDPGEVLVPSPLLTDPHPWVRLSFQVGPDGTLSSPQAPTGRLRDLAQAGFIDADELGAAETRLAELGRIVTRDALRERLPLESAAPAMAVSLRAPPGAGAAPQRGQVAGGPDGQAPNALAQRQRSQAEFEARERTFQTIVAPTGEALANRRPLNDESVVVGELRGFWQAGELLLARRLMVGGEEYVQGAWLDREALQAFLLQLVGDLLPAARLEPLRGEDADDARTRRLAALPLALVPAPRITTVAGETSSVAAWMTLSWACVALAAASVVALMSGTMALSERRAAFVSAVTHELRTPLTTFRLYTDLLQASLAGAPEPRGQYLRTLRTEAERLGRLVENVLAFAQPERGHRAARRATASLGALLDASTPRLEQRAAQSGAVLSVDVDARLRETRVRADPGAVEQVLFNLVDNACKYGIAREPGASGAAGGRPGIEITARRAPGRFRYVEFLVADRGPGVERREARRLFRAFHKSARQAADSAPGVGLGLAFCRRLARQMGGDVRLVERPDGIGGACFALRLRVFSDVHRLRHAD